MPMVTRPTLTPLGRLLLGMAEVVSWIIWFQLPPWLVESHRPAVALAGVTRPMLPRPISRRLLLNGSMTRSVTEASGVLAARAAPPTWNIWVGTRTLTQVRPPSVVLYTPGPEIPPLATP